METAQQQKQIIMGTRKPSGATISAFHITTSMGKYFGKLPFLSEEELEEFNSIGYSGKTIKGVEINRETYLNSLNKGEFRVTQTKFDRGDFEEKFTIIWGH